MFSQTPCASGIYIVTLNNLEPISVNADRPAKSDRCIKVNRENCKYGKAIDLNRRHKEYAKTFGSHNLNFQVVALVENPDQIESAVHIELASYRVRGFTGQLNEWLVGIDKATVEEIILRVVEDFSAHGAIPSLYPTNTKPKMITNELPYEEIDRPHVCERICAALAYLEANGMTNEQLRNIHHSVWRKETFAGALRYFGNKKELRGKNAAYGQRLEFIFTEHQKGSNGYSKLIDKALSQWPLA